MLKEPSYILNKKGGILKWKYNLNMVKFYKLAVIKNYKICTKYRNLLYWQYLKSFVYTIFVLNFHR